MKQSTSQKMDKAITETSQIMTLPGKSARPLKKRRIVSVEPQEEVVDDTRSQSSDDDSRRKHKRKEAKRARTSVSPLASPRTSPDTVIKKSVSWNEAGGNVVHLQPDPTQLYPYFNESDLWYTRKHYQDFLLDRLKTIESHRFLTANNMTEDDNNSDHCIRGLELFHEETSNEHFKSKKKLYHTTIQMEQMRQAMLGIRNPERFRELVASQSDLALLRAQELAAQDARESYCSHKLAPSNDFAAGKPLKSMSSSSFKDMKQLNNLMESIYGSAPSRDTRNSSWNNTPAAPVSESGSASVVSDSSSTDSTESSSGNSGGQSLFADESIRKLQERSMRRLMGIYQNNNGDGAEGSSETNSLFKFARRDSLLGLKNGKPVTSNPTDAPHQNSSWTVPPPKDKGPSPQDQLLEALRRRQLLQQHHEQQQQVAPVEDTSSVEEQIVDMLRQRQLLQEHLRQQLQQQQLASSEDTAPSLQEQLLETMKRRKMLEDHEHQQQTASSAFGNDNGVNTTRLIEEYLIQQQQHHEDHKNKMKLALMAMGSTRFPIRRDTLSHVNTNHNEVGGNVINHQSLPWSLSSMA